MGLGDPTGFQGFLPKSCDCRADEDGRQKERLAIMVRITRMDSPRSEKLKIVFSTTRMYP